MSTKKSTLLPRELVLIFKKKLSSAKVYHNKVLAIYFGISLSISGVSIYSFHNFFPEAPNLAGSNWASVAILGLAIISATVALLACRLFIYRQFGKYGIECEKLPFFLSDWGLGNFKAWQKDQVKNETEIQSLDDDQRKYALNSYMSIPAKRLGPSPQL